MALGLPMSPLSGPAPTMFWSSVHVQAHRLQVVLEPGVANRRRPHVDAAAPGAEIHRHADDADLAHQRAEGGCSPAE